MRIVPLLGRALARDLELLGAEDAHGARLAGCPRLVEPDVGEGRQADQARAVVGALDDPVRIEPGQLRAVGDGKGVGVALGEVDDCSVGGGLVSEGVRELSLIHI